MSRYAFEALSADLLEASPNDAAVALSAAMAEIAPEKIKSTGIGLQVMRRLSDVARDRSSPIAARQAAVRVLALAVADTPDRVLCSMASQYLAVAVTEHSFTTPTISLTISDKSNLPGALRAEELISTMDALRIKRRLGEIPTDTGFAEVINIDERWLGGRAGG